MVVDFRPSCPVLFAVIQYDKKGFSDSPVSANIAMKYAKIQEEELKNKVAHDFFGEFDCSEIIEKIDFAVSSESRQYFLWAEAKAASADVCEILAQLVLTIGKARTFDRVLPPPFLGCFDRDKIAFIPYYSIQKIFYQNDFNWKVTPSHRNTREFKQVRELVKTILTETPKKTYIFDFHQDEKELKQFIRNNFIVGKTETTKIPINKNNFISIYLRWLEMVKPTIAINGELVKKTGLTDGDFYLADLLLRENETLKEKLFVLLRSRRYILDRKIDITGLFTSEETGFTDKQRAHAQFWTIYERPSPEEYWTSLIERRALLVPQDIRERKGSFFTPEIWVKLSQKYIADALGKDWQDEYYVWDCAAGTGNLLAGLTNKHHIWASTIDKADVDVMHDGIDNGANLLKDHVFQFDFLNDDLSNLPEGLRDIINDDNKRKKLIVYINPPYAEARGEQIGKSNKKDFNLSKTRDKYLDEIGKAAVEMSAQFFVRICIELPDITLAVFSKIKYVNAPNFERFRTMFKATYKKRFVMPADTFDNVKGSFPVGFLIWDLEQKKTFRQIETDVYDRTGNRTGVKKHYCCSKKTPLINDWAKVFPKAEKSIATIIGPASDFQHQSTIWILSPNSNSNWFHWQIDATNLIPSCIYFTVRKVIPADWLNDRDQFLYPNAGWKADWEFRNNCFAYTLFHSSNNIRSEHGINHWISFAEEEVNARSKFKSNFMTDFMAGKIERTKKSIFSTEAKAVFKAGQKLWTYYHAQPECNVNASLYDIREHFQGRNEKGKMNNKSDDATYAELIGNLRTALKILATKIEPKVYKYGFLKK